MGIVNDLVVSYGISGDRLIHKMVKASRNGIPYEEFEEIALNSPLGLEQWAAVLHLSDRTLQRYKKDLKSFESIQSERILDLILLFKFGEDVFGARDLFEGWLNDISIPLGSQTPLSLLDTTFGIRLVRDELGRIQHGIFA